MKQSRTGRYTGTSDEEILRWYEAPKYGQNYKDLHDAILRQAAEAMGVTKEQMNNHTASGTTNARKTREINPGFKPTPKPQPRGVQIQTNVIAGPHVFEVMMPNGYYLADESGRPCNIGASHRDQSIEFRTVDEALAKFVKVAENFRRFWP